MTDLSAKTIQVLETRNRPASISVSLGSSKSQSNTAQTSDGARGSTVKAGGNVNIVAQGAGADSSILVRGSDITAGQDATLAAEGDIRLQAAQNTASLSGNSSSSSGSIGVSVGQQTGITVSASKGRGNQAGDDLTHTNTHIAAGNSVTLQSGDDTDLKGAVVSGKQVAAEVGDDLHIESLQDSSSYASRNQTVGGSLTISPAGVPIGGGLNAGQSKVNSNYQSVTEQSGIQAGDGGFQVSVKGDTDLKGGVIASNQTAIDQDKNRFSTEGALTTSDLHNSAHYDGQAVGVNASVGNDAGKFGVKGVGAGVGQDSGSAQGTTTAGISGIAGDQSVRTGDATGIERIFDQNKVQREIDAQVAITAEFGKQASKAVGDYAGRKYNELKDSDPVEAAKWSEGGAYRVAMHAVVGGLSGGMQGALGSTAASAAASSIDQLQQEFQSALQNAGLGEGAAKALASLAGGATAATIGAATSGGSAAGAATAFNADMNNRQLHPDERKWAKENAEKYKKYLYDKTGEQISTEDAYQRLLSSGYAVVDASAQNTGKSDEIAKQFISENTSGALFKATATERGNPLSGGNADGSYTPEQQARWGIRTPAEAASKLVTKAYDYIGKPCGNNCGPKFDAIVNAISGLEQARVLYQDDAASIILIDKQIEVLRSGITPVEIVRGSAQSIANTDKTLAFALLSGPSRIIAGRATANTLEAVTGTQAIKDIRAALPSDAKRGGNMAVAEVGIPGVPVEIAAHNFIPMPNDTQKALGLISKTENPQFSTSTVLTTDGRWVQRSGDSEAMIFESIANRLGENRNIKGTINLVTELKSCSSCLDVAEQFSKKYPNIEVNIFDNEGIRLTPNRIGKK